MGTTLETIQVTYPVNRLVTVFDDVATRGLRAYTDSNTGLPQDLDIGATGSINLQTLDDINITLAGGEMNWFDSTQNNDLVFQIATPTSSTTQVSSLTKDLVLTTGNNLIQAIQIGSTTITESNDYQVFTTTKPNGFSFNHPINFGNTSVFDNSVTVKGNLLANHNIFAQSLNAIRTYDPMIHPQNARLTGYAFVINDSDQLELVRYHTFADNTSVTQRVAIFGRGQLNSNDLSDYDFIAYEALSNVGTLPSYNPYPAVPLAYDQDGIPLVDASYLSALSNAVISTRASLTTLNTRFITLSNFTSDLSTTTSFLSTSSQTQCNQLQLAFTNISLLEQNLANTMADLATHKMWDQNNLNALNVRIAALSNTAIVLTNDLIFLEDQFQIVSDCNVATVAALSNALPIVSSIQQSNVTLSNSFASLCNQYANVAQNYATLMSTTTNLNNTVNAMSYTVTNQSTGLIALDNRVTNLSNNHFALLTRFNALSDTYPTLSNSVNTNASILQSLSNATTSLSNSTRLLQSDYAATKANFTTTSNQTSLQFSRQAQSNATFCNQIDALSLSLTYASTSNVTLSTAIASLSNTFSLVTQSQSLTNASLQTQITTLSNEHASLSNATTTSLSNLLAHSQSNTRSIVDLSISLTALDQDFTEFLNDEYNTFSNNTTLALTTIQDIVLPNHNTRLQDLTTSNQTLSNTTFALAEWIESLSNDVIYQADRIWILSNNLYPNLSNLDARFIATSNAYRQELNILAATDLSTMSDLQQLATDHDALYDQVQPLSNQVIPLLLQTSLALTSSNATACNRILALETVTIPSLDTVLTSLSNATTSLSNSTQSLSNDFYTYSNVFSTSTIATLSNMQETDLLLSSDLDTLSNLVMSNLFQLQATDAATASTLSSNDQRITTNATNITANTSNLAILTQSNADLTLFTQSLSNLHFNLRASFNSLSNATLSLSNSTLSLSNSTLALSNDVTFIRTIQETHTSNITLLTTSNATVSASLLSNIASLLAMHSQQQVQIDTVSLSNATTLSSLEILTTRTDTLSNDFSSLSEIVTFTVIPDIITVTTSAASNTTATVLNSNNITTLFNQTNYLPALCNLTVQLSDDLSSLSLSTLSLSNAYSNTTSNITNRTSTLEAQVISLQDNINSLPTGNNLADLQATVTSLCNYTYTSLTPSNDAVTLSNATLSSLVTLCNTKYDGWSNDTTIQLSTLTQSNATLSSLVTLCNANYDTFSNNTSLSLTQNSNAIRTLSNSVTHTATSTSTLSNTVLTLSNALITLSNSTSTSLTTLTQSNTATTTSLTTLSNGFYPLSNMVTSLSNTTTTLSNVVTDIVINGTGNGGGGVTLGPDVISTVMIQDGAVTNAKVDDAFLPDRFATTQTYNLNYRTYDYPPAPMFDFTFDITTSGYDNGIYTCSQSAESGGNSAYYMFDGDINTWWQSPRRYQNQGEYTGTTTTTYVESGNPNVSLVAAGEWVQLDLPSGMSKEFATYTIRTLAGSASQMPSDFILLGMVDILGVPTWINLDDRSGITSWVGDEDTTFSITIQRSVSALRLVFKLLPPSGDTLFIPKLSFTVINTQSPTINTFLNFYGELAIADSIRNMYLSMYNTQIMAHADTYFSKSVRFANNDVIDSTGCHITLEPNSVTGSMVQQSTITAYNLDDQTITTEKIAYQTILTDNIAPSQITSALIAESNVLSQHIAADAVTNINITDAAISNNHLTANCVNVTNLVDNSITASKLVTSIIPDLLAVRDTLTWNTSTNNANASLTWGGSNLRIRDTSITYMTLSNTNVGIGITTPTSKLHVSGDIALTGNVIQTSDARLKQNLQPIVNALDKIDTLQGYTFTMNDSSSRMVGLIAQDVQQVLPEAVSTDPITGYMGVTYGNMVALLVEAIKELKQEVAQLKSTATLLLKVSH
jgi:hypothetical protein